MIHLQEEVKSILNEQQNGELKKPVKSLRLPCSDFHKYKEPAFVQIFETRDQKVTCPRCGKSHFLVWSALENHRFA